MGRKIETIRWALGTAAKEFGLDPKTLSARLKARGIEVGVDGKLSTLQICEAVYGDLEGEKILKTREERIKLARENKTADRELLPTPEMIRIWSSVILEYRQRVLYAEIPQTTKEDLLAVLTEATIDEYFRAANTDSEEPTDESSNPS